MRKLGRRITKILAANPETFVVRLRYDDGSVVDVWLDSIFVRPKGLAAEIMRGGLFARCYVESGALAWPNGFELCPDALLMKTRPASLDAGKRLDVSIGKRRRARSPAA